MSTRPDSEALPRLLSLVEEALALSDQHALHATGIALDTARLSVEEAIGARFCGGHRQDESLHNGAIGGGQG